MLKQVRQTAEDGSRPCPCCESLDTSFVPRKFYGKGINQTIDMDCLCSACNSTWRSYDWYDFNEAKWFERLTEIDQKC